MEPPNFLSPSRCVDCGMAKPVHTYVKHLCVIRERESSFKDGPAQQKQAPVVAALNPAEAAETVASHAVPTIARNPVQTSLKAGGKRSPPPDKDEDHLPNLKPDPREEPRE